MKFFAISSAAVGAAVLISGCGGGGSTGDAIAKYGDRTVTRQTYLTQLETIDTIAVVLPNGQTANARPAQPMSTQALSKIVERLVIQEAARKSGKLPSKDDVEAEKKLRIALNSDFLNLMKAQGMTTEDVDDLLRTDLALYRLQVMGQKEKTIKDADTYVKEHPKEFTQPPQVSFRWIVVNDAAVKAKVDTEMANTTFGALAAKYSVVPTAKQDNGAFNSGGGITPRPVPLTDQLPAGIKKALEATIEGKTSNWFQIEKQWVKVKVEGKTPAQLIKPRAEQLELLRRELSRRDAMGANDTNKLLLDTLLAANIQVIPPYLKKNWDGVIAALKQRMSETAAAASTAPTNTPGAASAATTPPR